MPVVKEVATIDKLVSDANCASTAPSMSKGQIATAAFLPEDAVKSYTGRIMPTLNGTTGVDLALRAVDRRC